MFSLQCARACCAPLLPAAAAAAAGSVCRVLLANGLEGALLLEGQCSLLVRTALGSSGRTRYGGPTARKDA